MTHLGRKKVPVLGLVPRPKLNDVPTFGWTIRTHKQEARHEFQIVRRALNLRDDTNF